MSGDWNMRIKFRVTYNDGHNPDEFIDYTESCRIYVVHEDACQIKHNTVIYANGKWTNCDGYTKSHIELLVGDIDKIDTIEVFPYAERAV